GLFLLAFIASFYIPSLRIIENIFFALLAALAFFGIFKRAWSSKFLRQATVLIIVCTVLFSAIAFAKLLVSAEPSPELVTALKQLDGKKNNYAVLSSLENSYYITYFSNHPSFNPLLLKNNAFEQDLNTLFYSIRLDDTIPLVEKYNIAYFFITPQMTSGGLWSKSEQGLLFLFKNSEMFINIYSSKGHELWAYAAKENVI
ncbi:MAG: hypothetical protein V1659_04860, partial [Candidatus Woesearchaeota archaeon]